MRTEAHANSPQGRQFHSLREELEQALFVRVVSSSCWHSAQALRKRFPAQMDTFVETIQQAAMAPENGGSGGGGSMNEGGPHTVGSRSLGIAAVAVIAHFKWYSPATVRAIAWANMRGLDSRA